MTHVDVLELLANVVPRRLIVGIADVVAQLADALGAGVVGLAELVHGLAALLQQLVLGLLSPVAASSASSFELGAEAGRGVRGVDGDRSGYVAGALVTTKRTSVRSVMDS